MHKVFQRSAFLIVLAAGLVVASDRTSELESLARARVERIRSGGMVLATIDADGRSSVAADGDAGPGALPLDADSVFEIGSITKVFTATLLADMVDRGEVKLDDPVQKFLPSSVRVPQRGGRQITLLDLTTQSSGLPRMPDNLRPRNPTNPYADYTVDQMYAFLSEYKLTRDIGAQYEYSNLGVGLLGHALARQACKSYETLVTERILKPLHMAHTGITLTPWMQRHLVKGHDSTGAVVANWDIPALAGAGALRSTMNDMLVFTRANLTPPGRRLHRAMKATHASRRPTGRPDLSVGMGWHIRRANGHDIVWHNGGTGGYHTWIGFDEARGIAAVVLTDTQVGADDLGYELLK